VRVLDLAVADQDDTIRVLVEALLRWHKLICEHQRTPELDQETVTALADLRAAFVPFETAGISVATPKFHRARDMLQVIRDYGAVTYVSTDAYEMAHKSLKRVLLRCARVYVFTIIPFFHVALQTLTPRCGLQIEYARCIRRSRARHNKKRSNSPVLAAT